MTSAISGSLMMNGLSLCAGVGGLDLGVEIAFSRYRCIAAVENNPEAAAQFRRHFPETKIFRDVVGFDGRRLHGLVDCVLAGWPCQPHSVAGRRKGTEDERWIWEDIARILGETGAPFFFGENVSGMLRDAKDADSPDQPPGELDESPDDFVGGMGTVLRSLAEMGFVTVWGSLRAADVGASHGRARIFVLAYREGAGLPPEPQDELRGGLPDGSGQHGADVAYRGGDGLPGLGAALDLDGSDAPGHQPDGRHPGLGAGLVQPPLADAAAGDGGGRTPADHGQDLQRHVPRQPDAGSSGELRTTLAETGPVADDAGERCGEAGRLRHGEVAGTGGPVEELVAQLPGGGLGIDGSAPRSQRHPDQRGGALANAPGARREEPERSGARQLPAQAGAGLDHRPGEHGALVADAGRGLLPLAGRGAQGGNGPGPGGEVLANAPPPGPPPDGSAAGGSAGAAADLPRGPGSRVADAQRPYHRRQVECGEADGPDAGGPAGGPRRPGGALERVGKFYCGRCGGSSDAFEDARGFMPALPCPWCGDGFTGSVTYDRNHGGTGDPTEPDRPGEDWPVADAADDRQQQRTGPGPGGAPDLAGRGLWRQPLGHGAPMADAQQVAAGGEPGDVQRAPGEAEGEALQRQRHGRAPGPDGEPVADAGDPGRERRPENQSGDGTARLAGSELLGPAAERHGLPVADADGVGPLDDQPPAHRRPAEPAAQRGGGLPVADAQRAQRREDDAPLPGGRQGDAAGRQETPDPADGGGGVLEHALDQGPRRRRRKGAGTLPVAGTDDLRSAPPQPGGALAHGGGERLPQRGGPAGEGHGPDGPPLPQPERDGAPLVADADGVGGGPRRTQREGQERRPAPDQPDRPVADADLAGEGRGEIRAPGSGRAQHHHDGPELGHAAGGHGTPGGSLLRQGAPQRGGAGGSLHEPPAQHMAHAGHHERLDGRLDQAAHAGPAEQADAARQIAPPCGLRLFAPGPADPEWPGILRASPQLAPALSAVEVALTLALQEGPGHLPEEIEPRLHRLADGVASWLHQRRIRLQADGNLVVPLQAAVCFTELARRLGIEHLLYGGRP